MVNVSVFITSLKVTRLKRLIIFSDNDKWSILSRIYLNKLFSLGDAYSNTVIKDIRNPFWKNVLESWIQYIRSVKTDNLVKIMYSPLWDNTQINENGNYIVNEWNNKGIRNIMDIIDGNGLIYEFQELKQRYDIPGTYLYYMRLINKIPRMWRDMINEDSRKNASHMYNVQVNCYVFYLLRKRRGCRYIYMIKLFQ